MNVENFKYKIIKLARINPVEIAHKLNKQVVKLRKAGHSQVSHS